MLVGQDMAKLESIAKRLWAEIFVFERQFSRFVPASELSQFNRQAGVRTKVSASFLELLQASNAMSALTNQLHNPFILPALQKNGYSKSAVKGYENDPTDDYRSRKVVSPELLHIDEDGFVTIPIHTAIDMGGCGKGYLLDKLSKLLEAEDVDGYWLSLSGDIVCAGKDSEAETWRTTIQVADETSELPYIETSGAPLGIATSGTFRRDSHATKAQGWHHIIDPATGKPGTTDIKLATVVAKSAIQADVLASAAVLLGSEKAQKFLSGLTEVTDYCLQTEMNTTTAGKHLHETSKLEGVKA